MDRHLAADPFTIALMNTEQGLRAAIAATPDDPTPKLVYADWLEEQGDERCEALRALVQGDEEHALSCAGIEREDDDRSTIPTIVLKIGGWIGFAADCVDHVVSAHWSSLANAEKLHERTKAARTIRQRQDKFGHAAASGSSLDAPGNLSWAERELWSATVEATRIALSDPPHHYSLTPKSVSTAAGHARYAASVLAGSLRGNDALEDERRWQILRLCEYELFGDPLTKLGDFELGDSMQPEG